MGGTLVLGKYCALFSLLHTFPAALSQGKQTLFCQLIGSRLFLAVRVVGGAGGGGALVPHQRWRADSCQLTYVEPGLQPLVLLTIFLCRNWQVKLGTAGKSIWPLVDCGRAAPIAAAKDTAMGPRLNSGNPPAVLDVL